MLSAGVTPGVVLRKVPLIRVSGLQFITDGSIAPDPRLEIVRIETRAMIGKVLPGRGHLPVSSLWRSREQSRSQASWQSVFQPAVSIEFDRFRLPVAAEPWQTRELAVRQPGCQLLLQWTDPRFKCIRWPTQSQICAPRLNVTRTTVRRSFRPPAPDVAIIQERVFSTSRRQVAVPQPETGLFICWGRPRDRRTGSSSRHMLATRNLSPHKGKK